MTEDVKRSVRRADVVALARNWLGTPYHHQASAQGVGTDCIGLVRGIYRAFCGGETEPLPDYSRDWVGTGHPAALIRAARGHLMEIPAGTARHGDILIFSYLRRTVATHAGIMASDGDNVTLIHAMDRLPVSEVPLSEWWRRRIHCAFSFPGVVD